jgi:surface polysaccharide O-acyltransferase-like enzyme
VVSGEQGFMAYLLFGWLISRYNIPKRYRPLVYVLGICGWLTHMLGTLAVSTPEDGVNGLFKQYNNLPALLQAVALFTFVRNVSFDHGPALRIASICKQLTPLTLGVYLEHWYLIDLVSRLGLASPFSLKWRLVGPLLIFAACCACTWLLRRFRLTKHLVP